MFQQNQREHYLTSARNVRFSAPMELRQGNGGWYLAQGSDLGLPGRLYFRLHEVDGSLRLTELYLDGRGAPVTAGPLRRLPIAVLERGATAMADGSDLSRAKLTSPGPDLSRLAAYFSTTFGKAKHWVADSMRAQQRGSGIPQVPYPHEAGRKRPLTLERRLDPPPADDEKPRLGAPEDGRLTDEFLRDVARAYDAAVARREPPANALAALAGVSPRTVHRWVYTARKRGLMAPATSRGRIV